MIWRLGGHGLGVVALHVAAVGLHVLGVGVGEVDLALGLGGRRVGIRGRPKRRPSFITPARAVGLVVAVCLALGAPVLDQAPAAELEPLCAVPRHRLCLCGSLSLEPLLGLAKPGAPALAGAQVLGQLVAARLAVELVLGGVDAARLGEDLGGDLLVASSRVV